MCVSSPFNVSMVVGVVIVVLVVVVVVLLVVGTAVKEMFNSLRETLLCNTV